MDPQPQVVDGKFSACDICLNSNPMLRHQTLSIRCRDGFFTCIMGRQVCNNILPEPKRKRK